MSMNRNPTYRSGFASPQRGRLRYPGLWRGCVGAWNPGLGPTGLTLRDHSGYGNHGVLTNMDADSDWVASQGRHALDFDGSNDFVIVGQGPFYNKTNFAISFWMKGNEAPVIYMVPVWNSTRPSDFWNVGWGFYWNSSTAFRFFSGHYSLNQIEMTVDSPQSWNHYAATVQGTTQTVYLNGKQMSQNTSGTASPSDGYGLVFGEGNSATYNYACQLDSIAYYNRVLAPQEVKQLATRRGIAYETAPRRLGSIQSAAFKAYWATRRNQMIGGGVK